jgi:tetratricopeptide (TPR) repeat protein/DNA-binding HxlR family transcriptional regulator
VNETEFGNINNLMHSGEYNKALEKVEKHQKEKNLTDAEILSLSYLQCAVHRFLGNFEKVIELSSTVREKAKEQNNVLIEADALLSEIFSLYRLGELDKASGLVQRAEDLIENSNLKEMSSRRAYLLAYKAYVYEAKGEAEQAFIYAQQNYFLCKELDNPTLLALAYYILGFIHMSTGNMEKALENNQKSLEIREKDGSKYDLAFTLFNLGYAHRNLGNLDAALDYFNSSYKIRKKIGNQQDIAWTLLNLGDVYYGKGDLKHAQNYYEESLIVNQRMHFNFGTIFSFIRLSTVYKVLDDPQLVMDTLEKALSLVQKVQNVDPEVYILFELINYITEKKYIHRNALKDKPLKEYLERLNEINLNYKHKVFSFLNRLAKGLELKAIGDTKNKKKARQIFQQITEEEIISFDYIKIAITNYSELLAEELRKYFGEDTLVNQLNELSDSLSPVLFQQSFSMVAENFLNQSRSALEQTDIVKALELLKRAQYLCDFLGLYNKGPTPFRIIYSLFMKERNLNELSKNLKITKGALSSQLKLLVDLDIVEIAREEQVRSATMLKKYYRLGSRGRELLQPLNLNICDCIRRKEEDAESIIDALMKPRLIMKLIRDTTFLVDNFQNFLDEHVILKPLGSSSDITQKDLNNVKEMFSDSKSINIDHYFLTEKQYEEYQKLWREFDRRVKTEIIQDDINSSSYHSVEKPIYISHINLPIKDLMTLERYLTTKRKKQVNKKE